MLLYLLIERFSCITRLMLIVMGDSSCDLRGSIGRVIAVLRDRMLLLSLLVEQFVLTLINDDYYYYLFMYRRWRRRFKG